MSQEVVEIRFLTVPDRAQVFWGVQDQRQGQLPTATGFTGQDPVPVRVRRDVTHYPFRLHLDGFEDKTGDVKLEELSGPQPIVIDKGDFHPNSVRGWWIVMRRGWLLPGLGLLTLGALGAWLTRAALVRREQSLHERRQREVGSDALVGATLGRYHVLEKIGEGGMASVYRVALEQDELALKILHQTPQEGETRDRFYREVRISAKLRHPNITLLHEPLEDDQRMGMVMELVRGKTLRAKLNRVPRMAFPDLDAIIAPLASALAYAHAQGVIHRDLKPENVMISEAGSVKLMDFGIAQFADARLTAEGVAVGTLAYMAPEQIAMEELTPAVDQYALGLLIYEMLAGRPAFEDENSAALVLRRLKEKVPGVRLLRPEVPEAAAAVLARMVEWAPQDRFPSLKQAYEEFQKAYNSRR